MGREVVDHDQVFKTLIKEFFREFMELFLPQEAAEIDFARIEFLDKETFTDAPHGEKRVMEALLVSWGDYSLGSMDVRCRLDLETQRAQRGERKDRKEDGDGWI